MNTKILTQTQAEAVYSAMCALNNVGGTAADLSLGNAVIKSDMSGAVRIFGKTDDEEYASQHAFAAAYDLQQG